MALSLPQSGTTTVKLGFGTQTRGNIREYTGKKKGRGNKARHYEESDKYSLKGKPLSALVYCTIPWTFSLNYGVVRF